MATFLYNPTSRAVDSFHFQGRSWNVPEGRITEVDDEAAKALLVEFPFLEVEGQGGKATVEVNVETQADANQATATFMEKEQADDVKRYVCSICDTLREFDTRPKLNQHIKKSHEEAK